MKRYLQKACCGLMILVLFVVGTTGQASEGAADSTPAARVEVRLNTDEAEAVLAILRQAGSGRTVDPGLWDRLFSSEPYVRLKKREAEIVEMFNVPELKFGDEDFRKFVLSDKLKDRSGVLEQTLAAWKRADLAKAGERVLSYLPPETRIRAKVFPVIKPHRNSFVFELNTDPTIFLYLDPTQTEAAFENTVAHEMHHIGLASLGSRSDKLLADLPPEVRTAVKYLGAFGEGLAVLAAAGGPDIHPHAVSPAEERARWDSDMGRFDSDLREVERFLLDILQGKLRTEKEISEKGSAFFGDAQGAWYTVGYRMAVTVEKSFGRSRLVQGMTDPRRLILDYNLAVESGNYGNGAKPATWSPALLKALGLKS